MSCTYMHAYILCVHTHTHTNPDNCGYTPCPCTHYVCPPTVLLILTRMCRTQRKVSQMNNQCSPAYSFARALIFSIRF